jgi:hypothetical protein
MNQALYAHMNNKRKMKKKKDTLKKKRVWGQLAQHHDTLTLTKTRNKTLFKLIIKPIISIHCKLLVIVNY